jgi:hypothetical protein
MAVELILYNGDEVLTLRELLRPGLKAVFVGINPAPPSVKAEHYYQGNLGQRFWNRLRSYSILPSCPVGFEDDVGFEHGYGFADIVRRPTRSAGELKTQELRDGVKSLIERLTALGDRPLIIFTFAKAREFASAALIEMDYKILTMPGPYDKRENVDAKMSEIQTTLAIRSEEQTGLCTSRLSK